MKITKNRLFIIISLSVMALFLIVYEIISIVDKNPETQTITQSVIYLSYGLPGVTFALMYLMAHFTWGSKKQPDHILGVSVCVGGVTLLQLSTLFVAIAPWICVILGYLLGCIFWSMPGAGFRFFKWGRVKDQYKEYE